MRDKYVYVKVRQDEETPLQRLKGPFYGRFAYARAAETKALGDKGQDYLTFAQTADSFIFAICDGVSLSFYGDLAARFLGDTLLDWLSSPVLERIVDQQKLRKNLYEHLQKLTVPASHFIRSYNLPPTVTGLLRDVLEEKRERGSESTFICGRVDLPSKKFAEGRIILAWHGDSRLRIWEGERERTAMLGSTFLTSQRWSTHRGPIGGMPSLFVAGLQPAAISRLLVYTDGLAQLDDRTGPPDDRELQRLIDAAGQQTYSDDIALLELSWGGAPKQPKSQPVRLLWPVRRTFRQGLSKLLHGLIGLTEAMLHALHRLERYLRRLP
ncbi:hypothetical protein [Brevibacillus fulvus]|uniref:PPM-type phosphatase domain-containing protein n=1 Tax=Brevibacillus fulvus TaxID=1125967 RepID=A0A938Y1C4_9BACL|nr:hypothetical protein [Brevibacillus fulvus]MBM7589797.1 hypothetical protein [Brevibacillus fulvus]